jgi:hypothetical protein
VSFSLGPYVDFAPSESLTLRLFANVQLQPMVTVWLVKGLEAWRTSVVAANAGVALLGSP